MTTREGQAVLAIWNDADPAGKDDFNQWYTREHIPERVGVPGFLRGRRYVAVDADLEFCAFYDTESLDVLTSPVYLERLDNPTEWTRRVMPSFRNMNRSACVVTRTLGLGEGGAVATLRFGPRPGREDSLRTWLEEVAMPALLEQPGIVAAHLLEADPASSRPPTRERELRGGEDHVADWVLVVEGTGPDELQAACKPQLSTAELDTHGAQPGPVLGTYRLMYALRHEPGPHAG